jgi:hypothetical protein
VRRHDQIELLPQPSDHIVWVWAMISIDDCRDGEYAGVRQDLEVDRGISPLGNRNWNCGTHLVPVKSYRLPRTADVCHERVESVLVVHVEAIATEPCEEPEHSTKNRYRGRNGRCRFVGMHRRIDLPETFTYSRARLARRGTGRGKGTAAGGAPGSRSADRTFNPPRPSARTWCSATTIAAAPSASPVIKTIDHSG